MTIFDELNNIKESASTFLLKMVECYGSPDSDENVELEVKGETLIHTFDGMANIIKLVSRYNYDDDSTNEQPELQIVSEDIDFSTNHIRYTYLQLPIEGILELCLKLSEQFGFGDMFNELFNQAMQED